MVAGQSEGACGMPLDGTISRQQFNRELLISELRNNPPKDWCYDLPSTCAIGVAIKLGITTQMGVGSGAWRTSKAIGLSNERGTDIFYNQNRKTITPAKIADLIETSEMELV